MRFTTWMIAILGFSVAASRAAGEEPGLLSLTELAKQTGPAVLKLIVLDETRREICEGTGFLTSADGKLVTNYHVVEKGTSFRAKAANGEAFEVEHLISTDQQNDLATLKVKCKDVAFLKLGASVSLEQGSRIAVVGSPLGLEGSLSEGIVSAIRNEDGGRWIQMTAAISPGSSGSPVLNLRGEVIGVAKAAFRGGQALNIAIPVEAVIKLLAKSDTTLTQKAAEVPKKATEAPKKATEVPKRAAGDAKKPPANPHPEDPSPWAGQWKSQSGKDDAHWYPEMCDNKVPNDTLVNGNFEEGVAGPVPYPKGWAHPDGYCISWITDSMAPEHGKVIMLDTDHAEAAARKRQAQTREALANSTALPSPPEAARGAGYDAIAGTYGVSYYSEKFKCKPKQAYKVSFDYRGASGGAKVWVRGWGIFGGEERRRYETIVNCYVKGTGWAHFEQAFHPTRRLGAKDTQYQTIEEKEKNATYADIAVMRVMLYAYWPPGQYWFDNIKVEEISDEEFRKLKKIDAFER